MKATRWTLSNTKQMSKLWVDGVVVVQPVQGGTVVTMPEWKISTSQAVVEKDIK